MNDTSYVTVTTTSDSEALAIKLAEMITAARLASCVQFWPIRSVYWWQGKLESGTEFILQCKTRSSLAPALQEFIRSHHPYEVPEIIITPILGGHPPYLAWIDQETSCAAASNITCGCV
ncbi:MAG: divalent-cation tolerance protein CutA [bacterium]